MAELYLNDSKRNLKRRILNSNFLGRNGAYILLAITFFLSIFGGGSAYAQPAGTTEISVPFNEGFIGVQGNNPQDADNVQTFLTLGIAKAYFAQNSATGFFEAQGNDIPLSLRLEFANGELLDIPGGLVWRKTSTGQLQIFGFLATQGFSVNLSTYGGADYLITGGTVTGSSNFGLKIIGSSLTFTDNSDVRGDAAFTGLIDDLNDYLDATKEAAPAGPVSVTPLETCSVTPLITGTATLASGETLSIQVNGVSYPESSLTISPGSWSLQIPQSNVLPSNTTYPVTAIISNSLGLTLSDPTTNELVITEPCDSDGDGVSDFQEGTDGTDPNNFCDYLAASQTGATSQAWKDADCDGDGVTNGKETEDGTDPNNLCDYLAASQTVSTSQAWKDADCDGDGDKNETDNDPKDPCVSVPGSVADTSNEVWGAADCDGDGVTNGKETEDGTDPNNFCDYVAASQTGATSQAWKDADCDGDGVTNGKETEDGTDPNNFCDYVAASQTVSTSQAWKDADCDGDGDKNETDNDPKDPCVSVPGSVADTSNEVWGAADCDGDGVTNGKETEDGTDPNNFCDYVAASQTGATSQAWKDADCDGDGDKNETDNDPKDPCVSTPGSVVDTSNEVWGAADCDGDGVTNGKETEDGTDPNNFCDYVAASQTVSTSQAWKDADCDGDGDKNETDNDPKDPCVSTPGSVVDTSNEVWLAADCDGDGVTNGKETEDGTDPNNFCDYLEASQTGATSQAWKDADCDGDGDKNETDNDPKDPCVSAPGSVADTSNEVWGAADCDGDGVTNGKETEDGTDPNNFCDYVAASQTVSTSQAWKDADCDGDGVKNGIDIDPKDPCVNVPQVAQPFPFAIYRDDNLMAAFPDTSNPVWRAADCDGDGVTNGKETEDGTDPNNFCDYVAASQTVSTSQAWKDADCDGDGVKNGIDIDPKDPCVNVPQQPFPFAIYRDDNLMAAFPDTSNPVWRAADCDGDGVTNGKETEDGTDPNNFCDYVAASQTVSTSQAWKDADCDGDGVKNGIDIDPKDPCVNVPQQPFPFAIYRDDNLMAAFPDTSNPVWRAADCDGDGVTNGKETEDGTDPNNFCDYVAASQTVSTSQAWKDADCDGDGDKNETDNDPKDPCVSTPGSVADTSNEVWGAADCDGDGVTNGKETEDGTDPNNFCDYVAASQTVSTSQAWKDADCDGDGVSNKLEKEDGTDPLDPCSFIEASQSGSTSAEWKNLDCDGDGAKNGIDKNVLEPVALDDNTEADEGEKITINILSNDDFIAGSGISITRIGGTAEGEFSFDPSSGEFTYRGLPGEVGEVTVEYRVCNTQATPQICADATITIDIDGTNLLIPEAFTPNNNGKNDLWIIRGLASFPDNKVTVFNRWGNKVYEAAPYNNDWDGLSNSNLTTGGARVPAGSYFYVLELGNGKRFTGLVFVAY